MTYSYLYYTAIIIQAKGDIKTNCPDNRPRTLQNTPALKDRQAF